MSYAENPQPPRWPIPPRIRAEALEQIDLLMGNAPEAASIRQALDELLHEFLLTSEHSLSDMRPMLVQIVLLRQFLHWVATEGYAPQTNS